MTEKVDNQSKMILMLNAKTETQNNEINILKEYIGVTKEKLSSNYQTIEQKFCENKVKLQTIHNAINKLKDQTSNLDVWKVNMDSKF